MRAEWDDNLAVEVFLFQERIDNHRAVAKPDWISDKDNLIGGQIRQSSRNRRAGVAPLFFFRLTNARFKLWRVRSGFFDFVKIRIDPSGNRLGDFRRVAFLDVSDAVVLAGVGK